MSQLSEPIPIPPKDSPDKQHRQPSAGSSREGSPSSSSPGSKRKRRQEEDDDEDSKDQDLHPSKKRKTPPIESESSHNDSETPRVGQIQRKVEEMKVNRMSGGPYQVDPVNGLTKPPTGDVSGREQEPEKENDAADQPPSTPNKEEQPKPEAAEAEAQEIETDSEETSAAPVDTEMAVARKRANGLKRIPPLDRPIEIDPQEYNRKRKASEKLAGSPFSSPAAKRAKEDAELRIKSPAIAEEKTEPVVKPPSTPQGSSFSSGLKGFSAFASAASPFASVKSDNAPFGGGTRPSTIFGGGGAAPKFKSPFPVFSPFTTPKQPGKSSVFKSALDGGDPSQDLVKDTSTTPFPSASATPVFGTPSAVGTSSTPKSVFGRPSAFGVTASPSPSAAGPTRRAKSPRPSAFGAYATTAGRFAAPSSKIRARNKADENGDNKESDEATSGEEKGEEAKTKTFSEMLASKGSDREESGDEKMVFTEQETVTGEEEEINVFHGRGKLYHMVGAEWKERGPGVFKLNVNKETGADPRILMRREGALNLLINAKLFQGMKFAAGPDPRYVTFAILDEDLKPKSHLLRFHTAKLAQDLLERIRLHIPK